MEHRWGIRQPLEVDVKLYVPLSRPLTGRLLNVSASGGFVATSVTIPIMTRVHLTLGWDSSQSGGRHRIAAYVIRSDARGIGLEWQEFAPVPVLSLIDALEPSPSHDSRTGIRATNDAHQDVAYMPRSHPDCTFRSVPHRG